MFKNLLNFIIFSFTRLYRFASLKQVGEFGIVLRTLYLVRHACTSPKISPQNDFDCAIKEEEYAHLQDLSAPVKNYLQKIDYVYCSNAVRAKETCAALQPYFLNNPVVSYCDILYNKKEAYSEIIWDLLKEIPDSKEHVMIIGHNPGLTDFYNSFPVPNYEYIHFPTLGLATIQFYEQEDWKNMDLSSAIERKICRA